MKTVNFALFSSLCLASVLAIGCGDDAAPPATTGGSAGATAGTPSVGAAGATAGTPSVGGSGGVNAVGGSGGAGVAGTPSTPPAGTTSIKFALTDLKTSCHDTSGSAYVSGPLTKASLKIPTNEAADVPFDFCVVGVNLITTAGPVALEWGTNAWMEGSEVNATVNVQGAWFPFNDENDGGGSSFTTPANGTSFEGEVAAGAPICISGIAGQVQNGTDGKPAYGIYWGAAVGFNFNQPGGTDDTVNPWDPAANGVTGIEFIITGTKPSAFRIAINTPAPASGGDEPEYCANVI